MGRCAEILDEANFGFYGAAEGPMQTSNSYHFMALGMVLTAALGQRESDHPVTAQVTLSGRRAGSNPGEMVSCFLRCWVTGKD